MPVAIHDNVWISMTSQHTQSVLSILDLRFGIFGQMVTSTLTFVQISIPERALTLREEISLKISDQNH
jgi:hypothetical protein